MICYDFDGNKVWDKPFHPMQIYFGNGTSPVVVDGKVILNLDEPGEWTKNRLGSLPTRDLDTYQPRSDRILLSRRTRPLTVAHNGSTR